MSGSGERYRASFRFGAVERRGIAGGLRPGQVAVLGAACLFAVVVFRRAPNATGLAVAVAAVIAACLATWLPVAGKTIDEWTPIVGGWMLARALGSRVYRSRSPYAGVTVQLDTGRAERSRDMPPPLEQLQLLTVPLADDRECGVFVNQRDHMYIAVSVLRVRSFALLAAADQERRLERWGRVLASLARDGGHIRRLQLMERTHPHDEDQLSRWLASAGDRSIPNEAPVRRSYEALLESAADVTHEHEVLVALQVDPRRARTRSATTSSLDELGAQLALREMRALAERIEDADVGLTGLLTPAQCAWAVRTAFQPQLRRSQARPGDGQPLGPTAAEAAWDRYRCDGCVHRSYWIAQWPRLEVGPAFLAPLMLSPSAVRTFSVVVEPVSPAWARTAIEMAVTSDEADEQLRDERGFRTTARRRKQQAATRRREAELADGHEEVRFAGFITVSGRSDDELERGCDEIAQAAQQAYLDLQPMWGQQDVGFICGALPLCHGLARARLLER
jgi:hypothetical protein